MNLLFPLSVTVSTVVAVMLVQKAAMAVPGSFEAIGFTLLSTLMVLAVIEHWFLVVPLPGVELWSWGLASRKGSPKGTGIGTRMGPDLAQGAGRSACQPGTDQVAVPHDAALEPPSIKTLDTKVQLPVPSLLVSCQRTLQEGSPKPVRPTGWTGHVTCAGVSP